MIASLPMYDMPWLRAETDRLWQSIVACLPPDLAARAPDNLDRDTPMWDAWRAPDLLLGQTCGLPYRARLHGAVTLVATPVHPLPGCQPGTYHSVLVRRRGDPRDLATLRGGVQAVNEALSQSGWAAPTATLADHGLTPGRVLLTGAHKASLEAVGQGQADFAAVDAVTFHLLSQGAPEITAPLDIFARTAPTPALPFITAPGHDAETLRAALSAGIAALTERDRTRLCIEGVTYVSPAAYRALPIPAPPAP